jgi:hypothetical protein
VGADAQPWRPSRQAGWRIYQIERIEADGAQIEAGGE